MKKSLLLLMLLVAVTLSAQVNYVPFDQVRHIAIENAKSLWGEVYADEPIPLYSIDGNLIAYTFNFSIGQPFPSRQTLIERCNSPAGSEEKTDRWLVGQFANMLVSAGSNMTPILKYSEAISDDYAYGATIAELASQKLQTDNCGLEKIIFMSDMAKWYVYSDHSGNKTYVKVFPPVEVYNENEFNEAVQQRYTKAGLWVIPEDNENLWTSFLNGKLLNGKATTLIPDEDYVPYYDWSYGCTPTAFSMALAYWDNRGMISANDYGNLVKHHFQRYDHVQGDTDKNVPDLQKALAIAMSTDSMTGSTGSCCWLSGFIDETDARGYSFTGLDKYGTSTEYLNWAKTEINSGRPYHMGTPGHSNTGVGYTSDNYLIRHDTWQPSHSSVYYTSCDLVGTIVPGGQYGAAVNITSPFGDPRYTDNVVPPSQGEHLYAGDRFEITWDYDSYPGSYARLLYSTNSGYNWTVISSNTPNDGLFDWSIPSGLSNSSLGRVKVEVRDGTTTAIQAADGSYGNFDFHAGGSLPTLSEDVSSVTTTVPDYYQFANTSLYWGVVGLRATNGTDDWDIELHSGTAFNDVIASSSYGGATVDFVVIDGNHTPSANRGIKARRYSGTSTARVEYEGGSDFISAGVALITTWPANDVVEIYDVNLNPGTYGFILDVTSGTANLDFALYGSNGSAYYASRSAHLAMSNSGGAGGDEYFTFTVTTADWYGLCLWANDANTANYTLRVEPAGTWTGIVSNNWHDPANWSGNIVPDASIDVTIPDDAINECWVYAGDADCKNLTIASGTYFRNYNKTVTINGNLTINGQLMMDFPTPDAITLVTGNVIWNSGSTAWIADQTYIKVYGDWNFNSGSNANLVAGFVDFMGSTTSWIRCYSSSSSFYNLRNYKTGGASANFSDLSTNDLVINGLTFVSTGAIFRSYSNYEIIMKGNFNYYGSFDFSLIGNTGSVVFDGNSQTINNYSSGSGTFNNVVFSSSTGTSVVGGDLIIAGDVIIDEGNFNPGSVNITVKGNWTNSVGISGLIPGTCTIIFDSGGNDQDVYGINTFYNVTQINTSKYLRFNANTTIQSNLVLNYFCWAYQNMDIQGVLDISNASSKYTANGSSAITTIAQLNQGGTLLSNGGGSIYVSDLAQNYLWGRIEASSGSLIDITNSGTGTWVDLIGKLINNGGTINISGSDAYWPYSNGAELIMSAGVIDLKTCGLTIPSNAYTWTCNITGGTIKTSRGFSSYRADFSPSAGIFEFYGTGDYYISQVAGSTLPNVKINKGAANDNEFVIGGPVFDERSGIQLSDGGKSNTITLSSNFTITSNLDIAAGTFDLGAYTCNVSGTTDIYGTLTMTNAANDLTAGTINWQSGSNDNVTAGTFHANNWRFNEGTNAKLGLGNTANIYNLYYPSDNDAEFGNLVAVPASKVLEGGESGKAYYPVRVAGNFTIQNTNWSFGISGVDVLVGGNASILSDANLSFFSGTDFTVAGNLNLTGALDLNAGSAATIGGEFTFPSTGLLYINQGSFTNNYSTASVSLAGTLQLIEGIVEFPNRSVSISSTFNDQISGGVFRVGKTLSANSAGTFQPLAGTVEFVNPSAGNYVQVTNGNYLHNMVLDKPGSSFQVYDNLTIKGSLFIDDGVLNSNNKTISIGENWYNNVGTSAFNETNSRVIFNGTTAQFCSTEDFHILEVNKPMELLYNLAGHNITCQIYDWTSGGIWISPGNFTAYDLADNGLFGTFAIYSGTMNLHQDGAQYVDINGTVIIGSGAELNVFGGATSSYWPYYDNATVIMTGGVLDFKDVGILVYNTPTYSFTESITAGTIRTAGNMMVSNSNFTPTGGTVELYGGTGAGLSMSAGNFHNVLINKSGGEVLRSEPVAERDGTTTKGTRANTVNVTTDLLINNDLTIESGSLNLIEADVSTVGNVNVNSGGVLVLNNNCNLLLASGKSLSINDGGTINALGNLGAEARISRISTGNYAFDIHSGANIGAMYTIFEHMNTNGVNVNSGAIVDPAMSFTNCNFRNGQSGGRLLTLNNDQSVLMSNVVFPGSSGNFNVSKTVDAGVVVLSYFSGAFAGPTYEQDTYSRIHWTGELSPTVTLDGVLIGSGQDLCFEALQTITVGGSQSFIVENSGNVNLVAGQNIRLLEGTHVLSGAYLHAWITTDGIYCGSGSSMLAVIEENNLTGSDVEKIIGQSTFRVYPNPTRGSFTLDLDEVLGFSSINVDIYNVVGEKILSFELPEFRQYEFDLTDQQPGVFFIRVLKGDQLGVEKIIRQ